LPSNPSAFYCYETNFGLSSACGARKPKIGFLKASRRLAFKKPIFKMRTAVFSETWERSFLL
jgi:hypothetical protein